MIRTRELTVTSPSFQIAHQSAAVL